MSIGSVEGLCELLSEMPPGLDPVVMEALEKRIQEKYNMTDHEIIQVREFCNIEGLIFQKDGKWFRPNIPVGYDLWGEPERDRCLADIRKRYMAWVRQQSTSSGTASNNNSDVHRLQQRIIHLEERVAQLESMISPSNQLV